MATVRSVHVVAALIVRGGKILIAQRPAGKARAGQWEFPGGKREDGESAAAALSRELREELGVEAAVEPPVESVTHDYPDLRVTVDFHPCRLAAEVEVARREHARLAWVAPSELAAFDFVEADRELLPRLAAWAASRGDR